MFLQDVCCTEIHDELRMHSLEKCLGVVSKFFQCSVAQACFFSLRPCLRRSYCVCSCIGWLLSLHCSFVFFIFCFMCASWYGLLAWPGLCTGALVGLREAGTMLGSPELARSICMTQQQHPSAAAALGSELLCYCSSLHWSHFQSCLLSSVGPVPAWRGGPCV